MGVYCGKERRKGYALQALLTATGVLNKRRDHFRGVTHYVLHVGDSALHSMGAAAEKAGFTRIPKSHSFIPTTEFRKEIGS